MRILVFGDSIVQGFYDTNMAGWVSRLSARAIQKTLELKKERYFEVFNLGISGDNTEKLLRRFSSDLLCRKDEKDEMAVLFSIGVNDSQYERATKENRVSLTEFEKNVSTLISEAKEYAGSVVVIGITPIEESRVDPIPWKPTHGYTEEYVEKYDAVLEKVAHEKDVTFVGMRDVFSDPRACLFDGLHPNEEGHECMYERIRELLEKEEIL